MSPPLFGPDILRALLPFIVVAVGATLTTLLGAWRTRLGLAAAVAVLAVAVLALRGAPESVRAWEGALVLDRFSLVFMALLLGAAFFTLFLSEPVLRREGRVRAEYYGLLLFSLSGMFLLVSTTNLLMIFLALELLSIPLYVLCGYAREDDRSIEAAMKYFVLGSFSSAIFLFGAALLFGATGTIDLAAMHGGDRLLGAAGVLLLLVGFFFKAAAVPFHMWAPDVYDGAPTPIASFMATAVKIATFGLLLRVLSFAFAAEAHPAAAFLDREAAEPALRWIAILTMSVGNLSALTQNNVKRMLAYSSIAHAGYLFLGLIPGSGAVDGAGVTYYLVAYLFMTSGAFAVIAALSAREGGREVLTVDRFAGVGYRRPFLGLAMTIFLVSLAGIPPTAGFFGKYLLFRGAIDRGLTGLVVIAVLNSALSLYYYLRVVVFFYMKETDRPAAIDDALGFRLAMIAALAGVLWIGFMPDLFGLPGIPSLLGWVQASVSSLP
jgi:NADH-quinone oxidoreductase subunit N